MLLHGKEQPWKAVSLAALEYMESDSSCKSEIEPEQKLLEGAFSYNFRNEYQEEAEKLVVKHGSR